jgi:hypothetical protein
MLYVSGRSAWVGYARAGGAVVQPSLSEFGWAFPILSTIGLGLLAVSRRGRATAAFVAVLGAQALALFELNRGHGPGSSYMALKMVYLAVCPLAVAAAVALAAGWNAVGRFAPFRGRMGERFAWLLVVLLGITAARWIAAAPRPQPAITERLNLAGKWARAHVNPECVDYLVASDAAAYWLHLAVLGNPRMSPRTADTATFDPRSGIVRWITPGGLPFAIADLSVVPKDVQQDFEVLAQFGSAAVVSRRNAGECPIGRTVPSK